MKWRADQDCDHVQASAGSLDSRFHGDGTFGCNALATLTAHPGPPFSRDREAFTGPLAWYVLYVASLAECSHGDMARCPASSLLPLIVVFVGQDLEFVGADGSRNAWTVCDALRRGRMMRCDRCSLHVWWFGGGESEMFDVTAKCKLSQWTCLL